MYPYQNYQQPPPQQPQYNGQVYPPQQQPQYSGNVMYSHQPNTYMPSYGVNQSGMVFTPPPQVLSMNQYSHVQQTPQVPMNQYSQVEHNSQCVSAIISSSSSYPSNNQPFNVQPVSQFSQSSTPSLPPKSFSNSLAMNLINVCRNASLDDEDKLRAISHHSSREKSPTIDASYLVTILNMLSTDQSKIRALQTLRQNNSLASINCGEGLCVLGVFSSQNTKLDALEIVHYCINDKLMNSSVINDTFKSNVAFYSRSVSILQK